MDEIERRLTKLEVSHDDLQATITRLNTTIALLNQTVETMTKNEEKRQQMMDRTFLFVVGAIVSTIVAWVVRGGLAG